MVISYVSHYLDKCLNKLYVEAVIPGSPPGAKLERIMLCPPVGTGSDEVSAEEPDVCLACSGARARETSRSDVKLNGLTEW